MNKMHMECWKMKNSLIIISIMHSVQDFFSFMLTCFTFIYEKKTYLCSDSFHLHTYISIKKFIWIRYCLLTNYMWNYCGNFQLLEILMAISILSSVLIKQTWKRSWISINYVRLDIIEWVNILNMLHFWKQLH